VGQILTIAKAKWVLIIAFFFFMLGSLIAAVSKSMTVLIVGRAIQGVGMSFVLWRPST
jgi:predicted MFS family arabinose efflux permease